MFLLSLQVFRKILIIFGLIAVPLSLLALWFGADATFKEKMMLSLVFGDWMYGITRNIMFLRFFNGFLENGVKEKCQSIYHNWMKS